MRAVLSVLLGAATVAGGGVDVAAQAPPPAEEQIAAALHAAPEDRRAGAAVLGYDGEGKPVTLRKGSNDLVCLADDPGEEGFGVACYHESLEPFMARGRELSAEGVTGMERHRIRWAEARDGELPMPESPATLHVLSGPEGAYDPAADEVRDGYRRWVIYVPYATAASTGLSTRPSRGGPWLMYPGTPEAHIMITPPRDGGSGGGS